MDVWRSERDGLRGSVDGSIPWIALKSPAAAQRFIPAIEITRRILSADVVF